MNVRTVYPRNSKIGDFQSKDKTKPNLNRIYDMPDKVFTEFGNLDGLRCGAGIPTLWLSVVSCGVSYPTRRVSKGELS